MSRFLAIRLERCDLKALVPENTASLDLLGPRVS